MSHEDKHSNTHKTQREVAHADHEERSSRGKRKHLLEEYRELDDEYDIEAGIDEYFQGSS